MPLRFARQSHRFAPPANTRSLLAGLATATVLATAFTGLITPTVASAATTTDAGKVGLYGSQDPTYDGVYRQSLSLLALVASGQTPPAAAVSWLTGQQCADGSFESYRADVSVACTAPDSASFSGSDSNSTGIAVQALKALGKASEATAAVTWLGAHQNTDGGWAYYPDGVAGNDSDANSTALGLSAYLANGTTAPTNGGKSPQDALDALQVGCAGAVDERGAYTFFGSANDFATVQATLARAGGFLPVAATTGADDAPVLTCPPKAGAVKPKAAAKAKAGTVTVALAPLTGADYAAGYLVNRLAANADVIPDPFNPGSADIGSTANAVLAIVAAGHGSSQVQSTITALEPLVETYAHKAGADVPGALATLILTAEAAGADPTDFGGTNLLTRLSATVTTLAASPSPSASASVSHPAQPADPSPSVSPQLAATGAGTGTGISGLLAGSCLVVGTGLVLAVRRRSPARHGHGS